MAIGSGLLIGRVLVCVTEALPGHPGLNTAYFLRLAPRTANGRPAREFADWVLDQAG